MGKKWTPEDIKVVQDNIEMPIKDLAEMLGRTMNAVSTMKSRIGTPKYYKYGGKPSTNAERKRRFYALHRERVIAQIKSSEKYINARKKTRNVYVNA